MNAPIWHQEDPPANRETCGGDYRGSKGGSFILFMSKWFPTTILVLAVRLIPVPINTKKTCKDAKKSLTEHQASLIDTFLRSILAIYIYIRYGPRSHRSNNTKSFFLLLTPLFTCQRSDWVCWCGGCVKEKERWRVCVYVCVYLPAMNRVSCILVISWKSRRCCDSLPEGRPLNTGYLRETVKTRTRGL